MTVNWTNFWAQFKYQQEYPLLFNSALFFFLFLFLLLVYQLVYKKKSLRVYTVTLFSLYFFYKACGWYVGFILLAAVVDFNLSNIMYYSVSHRKRKLLLIFSIILNLGLLSYFKYTNFFLQILTDIGAGHFNPIDLYLPVGISFYTFENLSYTIDVYRGKIKPVDKFMDYLFFLSFFPKLMMGPIVRAADFIPQIRKDIELKGLLVAEGLFLILTGLFKKVVISDYINLNLVKYVFDDPSKYTGLECLFAVYGYALVIYCDFSGYSDMAIGMAKWIGFDINKNFDSPYQSSDITEFWRRWHMSLSSWLRDYLYISLGGNRYGKIRTYLNLMITMLLGGIWHGASFNFLVWGLMHGIALAVHKITNEFFAFGAQLKQPKSMLQKIIGIVITFHFVCFCWIFFRATSFSIAFTMIKQIYSNFYIAGWIAFAQNYANVLWVMLLGYILHFIPQRYCDWLVFKGESFHWVAKAGIAIVVIYLVIQFKQADAILPVYLQF